jgi:hypothetical protein
VTDTYIRRYRGGSPTHLPIQIYTLGNLLLDHGSCPDTALATLHEAKAEILTSLNSTLTALVVVHFTALVVVHLLSSALVHLLCRVTIALVFESFWQRAGDLADYAWGRERHGLRPRRVNCFCTVLGGSTGPLGAEAQIAWSSWACS